MSPRETPSIAKGEARFEEAVAQFGTDAVIKYRDLPAIRKNGETGIPEACLSLCIASKLITNRQQDARVESVLSEDPRHAISLALAVTKSTARMAFGGRRPVSQAGEAVYAVDRPARLRAETGFQARNKRRPPRSFLAVAANRPSELIPHFANAPRVLIWPWQLHSRLASGRI